MDNLLFLSIILLSSIGNHYSSPLSTDDLKINSISNNSTSNNDSISINSTILSSNNLFLNGTSKVKNFKNSTIDEQTNSTELMVCHYQFRKRLDSSV